MKIIIFKRFFLVSLFDVGVQIHQNQQNGQTKIDKIDKRIVGEPLKGYCPAFHPSKCCSSAASSLNDDGICHVYRCVLKRTLNGIKTTFSFGISLKASAHLLAIGCGAIGVCCAKAVTFVAVAKRQPHIQHTHDIFFLIFDSAKPYTSMMTSMMMMIIFMQSSIQKKVTYMCAMHTYKLEYATAVC